MLPFYQVALVSTLTLAVLIRRTLHLISFIRRNPNLPRRICLIQPMTILGGTVPTTRWNPGLYWCWYERETLYRDAKAEAILVIPLLWGPPTIYSSSPELYNTISGFNGTYDKPALAHAGMNRFGPNVVASNKQQWRRYRKITAPAFDNKVNELVWEEVIKLYGMLCEEEGWNEKEVLDISSIHAHTKTLTLGIISATGFDEPMREWRRHGIQTNHDASLQETVAGVADAIFPWSLLPPWIFKVLPIEEMKRAGSIFERFESLIKAKISSRKIEIEAGEESVGDHKARDLFTRLLQANIEGGGLSLSEQEFLGNCFAFLFAGHETTASTIAVTLALLALHSEEQDRAFEAVKAVTQGNKDPALSDFGLLSQVQACCLEAIRLYPAGYIHIRESSREDVFVIPGLREGKESPISIPSGTMVIIDSIGANRNSRHFPDPHIYKPSRWNDSIESFLGFSVGPRSCLGRKFATVEMVCFIALILRDWKVEPLFRDRETKEEWKERVLKVELGMTLTVGDVPLKFTRRSRGI